MSDFLKHIIQSKQAQVNSLKQVLFTTPMYKSYETEKLINAGNKKDSRLLLAELEKPDLTVIAEIKRHSPSKGFLGSIENPGELACQYVAGGARVISVLTDYDYFRGTLDDLQAVKKAVKSDILVLRKDFIIDPVQLIESLLVGADVVLLIAKVLKNRLREFVEKTALLGLEAIIEIHNLEELELAIESGAQTIGINSRDLTTFEISLDASFDLIQRIPHGIFAIAESGISHPSQARLCHQAGFSGVLIGEALVLDQKPARFIQACLGNR